jgi:hypothetical protein
MRKRFAGWRRVGVIVVAIVVSASAGSALPSFGNNVDRHCTDNARDPATPYAGDCAICHDANDSGRNRTPLFSAYRSGDLDAFCPPSVNRPPQFEPLQNQTVSEDAILSLAVRASDPDGDRLTLEAASLPTGARFDDQGGGAGQLVWMPGFDQAGSHRVTFTATDMGTPPDSAMAEVTITVGNSNRPPALGAIGNRTATAGLPLSVELTATDPDGDRLEFGGASLPAAASIVDFGNGSGRFEWTPVTADVGTHSMTLSVTDAGIPMASDSEEIQITVSEGAAEVNRPPLLDPIGDRSFDAGAAWTISLGANDPCDGAPGVAALEDAGNGAATLRDVAGVSQPGNYAVTCSVTDTGAPPLSDAESFTLSIGAVNRPPVLDPPSVIRQDGALFVPLVARDPDGDRLRFSVVGMPDGADFVDNGDGTAELSWLPPAGYTGRYEVMFTVRDDGNPEESASQDLTLSVEAAPSAIRLRKVRWSKKRAALLVVGRGAPANAIVEVFEASTGNLLGQVAARRSGRFRGRVELAAPPCAIRVSAEGEVSAEVPVAKAGDSCGSASQVSEDPGSLPVRDERGPAPEEPDAERDDDEAAEDHDDDEQEEDDD